MNLSILLERVQAIRPGWPIVSLAAATCVAALSVQMLPPPGAAGLNAEDGPFEIASAVILGAGTLLGLAAMVRHFSLTRACGFLLALGLFLRELDFQKRFTYRSIESIGFYARPIASWTEKIVALSILLALGLAAWVVARFAWRRLPQALHRGERWLGSIVVGAGLLACGLVCEKFLGFTVAEEAFETGFACVAFTVLWQTSNLTVFRASEKCPQAGAGRERVPLPQVEASRSSRSRG